MRVGRAASTDGANAVLGGERGLVFLGSDAELSDCAAQVVPRVQSWVALASACEPLAHVGGLAGFAIGVQPVRPPRVAREVGGRFLCLATRAAFGHRCSLRWVT